MSSDSPDNPTMPDDRVGPDTQDGGLGEAASRIRLHGEGSNWPETNCALDMWIEVLDARGLDTPAVMGSAFAADCFGDHWEMLKPATDDLEEVLGVRTMEFSPWKSTLEHVLDHLELGHWMTVEVDSWWLPDTAGTAYRADHVKTSIVPMEVDPEAETLTYLHNAGRYSLSGEDFRGVFALEPGISQVPMPYLELIRFDPVPGDVRDRARASLRHHLQRRADDPVRRLDEALVTHGGRLVGDEAAFHRYTFVTCRQLGGTAQVAAGMLRWLDPELERAAAEFDLVSQAALTAQFQLARAARRKREPKPGLLGTAPENWGNAMELVDEWLNR